MPPEVVDRTQVVKSTVKVFEPCVSAADLPKRPVPTPVDLTFGDPEQIAAATLADLINMTDYANGLESQLVKCVEGATP